MSNSATDSHAKVWSNILLAIDLEDLSALVLLELSATFNRSSGIFIQTWCRSAPLIRDLLGRLSSVRPGLFFNITPINYLPWCAAGIGPQFDPIPVVQSRTAVADPVLTGNTCCHAYADDTQIYGSYPCVTGASNQHLDMHWCRSL